MSQDMQEYILQNELTFYSPHLSIGLQAGQLLVQKKENRWLGWQLVLETDYAGWEKLTRYKFFGDSPENRLTEGEIEFRENKPVLLKIALRPELYELLPPASGTYDTMLPTAFSQAIASRADLLNEAGWYLHQAWQEIKLDPSIGGGALLVGYRTVWSPPRNEIDKLKRQGSISKAIVEAFIENSLPVRYNAANAAFELTLVVDSRDYLLYLYPKNADDSLLLNVFLPVEVPENSAEVEEQLDQLNRLATVGYFEVENQKFCYKSTLTVSPELLSDNFITEMLHATLAIVHQATNQANG